MSAFVTCQVAYSVGYYARAGRGITDRAVEYLANQKEGVGLWRFWCAGDPKHKYLPADIDDTAVASHLLQAFAGIDLDNRRVLLANASDGGGLYTWIVPRDTEAVSTLTESGVDVERSSIARVTYTRDRDTIDAVANANALLYLGDESDTRAISTYLGTVLEGPPGQKAMPYYPTVLSLYYSVTRAALHGVASLRSSIPRVTAQVFGVLESGDLDELGHALGACAILNAGERVSMLERSLDALLSAQLEDGSWPARPAFLGPAPYYGSAEYTTAIAFEALSRASESR